LAHARAILPELPASGSLSPEEMLDLAIERNVLLQVEHLKTLPSVVHALAAGKLRIHAWVYHFETGDVVAHDPQKGRFVPLGEAPHQKFVKEIRPLTGSEDEWHDSI
jgi:carbonic anhydrase